jgi:RNA polymerase sigma factor (sigma-70 family)
MAATRPLADFLQAALAQGGESVSDGQLLEHFLARRDEAAFAALVQRHGPMVLAVCRRVLGNLADAEDAFQAAFLVLVRRGAALAGRASLGAWLHGVARRTALKARVAAAHRRHKEQAMARPEAQGGEGLDDWLVRLDEELARLPEKYRAVIVLCDLEGRTRKEAAGLIGVPEGTVAGRLARARQLLARRLARPEAALPAAPAGLPAALASATVQAAAGGVISANVQSLVQGVLKVMLLRKLGKALAVLVVLGAATFAWGLFAAPQEKPTAAKDSKPTEGKARVADLRPLPARVRLGSTRLRHSSSLRSLALSSDGRTLASADYWGLVRLWDTRSGEQRLELPAETATVVAFSPDGRTLATGYSGKGIRLRRAADGKEVLALADLDSRCLAFSPDGKTLAGADRQNQVVLCDTASGRITGRLKGLEHPVLAIAFSADGKAVAAGDSAGRHRAGTVVVWERDSGKVRCRMSDEEQGWVHGVAFSGDGKLLASATPYHVCLWDAHTGKRIQDLGHEATNAVAFVGARLVTGGEVQVWDTGKRERLRSLARGYNFAELAVVSRDGRLIASNAVYDERIRLWDAETGKERLFGSGHLDQVRAVAFSPDSRWLATGSGGDGSVRVWDPATGREKRILRLKGERYHSSRQYGVRSLAFSPGGDTLQANGQRWDTATWSEKATLPAPRQADFSPDGRLFLSPDSDREGLHLHEATTGRVLHRLQPPRVRGDGSYRADTPPAFSADGRLLAIPLPNPTPIVGTPARDTVQLWDTATGRPVRTLCPAGRAPETLAFSPDGVLLATSGWRGKVQLWSVATGQLVHTLSGYEDGNRHWDTPCPLAFSPDGALLATGGKDNVVVLWETISGKVVRLLRGHEGRVVSLTFSPDGRRLASGGADTTALVWAVVPPGGEAVPASGWEKDTPARLWQMLAGDPETAYPAAWALLAAPEKGLALLKDGLRPDEAVDQRRLDQLVKDLGSDDFHTREKATRELGRLGRRAESALRRGLDGKVDLEQRHRIERLLKPLDARLPIPDELRDLRGIGVLERLGSPAAEAVLKQLARGVAGPRTRAARAALLRLEAARQRQR